MGEEGKPQKRYHVLLMRESRTKQASWLCTDGLKHEEMPAAIGQWIIVTLRRFRLKCFGVGAVPDISFTPLVMTQEAMDELEMSTWRCELGELIADVERSTEG